MRSQTAAMEASLAPDRAKAADSLHERWCFGFVFLRFCHGKCPQMHEVYIKDTS